MFGKIFNWISGGNTQQNESVIAEQFEEESNEPHMFQNIIDATSTNKYFRITALDSGSVTFHFEPNLQSNKTESKLTIKEMKLAKKMLSLEKKEVQEHLQNLRLEYRQSVANQAPTMRGGGKFGQVVRVATAYNRANARANQANSLRPFEDFIQHIDTLQIAIDRQILRIESQLVTVE